VTPFFKLWMVLPRGVRRFVIRRVTPTFTAGAITLIEREDGRILFARLAYVGGWNLPGGHLKRGEPAAEAAVRETREEVGLEVELLGDPAVVVDPVLGRIDTIYWARPAAGVDPDSARSTSLEITEVGWFPPGELPQVSWITRTTLWAATDTWLKLNGDVPAWAGIMHDQVNLPDIVADGGRATTPVWTTPEQLAQARNLLGRGEK
jgi:8-oxo-dGTP diphosphatase